jgi:hypothetical protein
MKPSSQGCVSSMAAAVLGRKPSPPAYEATGGLWRSPHLLLTLNSSVARGVGLGVGVGLLLVKRPGAVRITALALA